MDGLASGSDELKTGEGRGEGWPRQLQQDRPATVMDVLTATLSLTPSLSPANAETAQCSSATTECYAILFKRVQQHSVA